MEKIQNEKKNRENTKNAIFGSLKLLFHEKNGENSKLKLSKKKKKKKKNERKKKKKKKIIKKEKRNKKI